MPIINSSMARDRATIIPFPSDRMVEGRYEMIKELNRTSMSVRLAKQDKFVEGLVDLYSSRIVSKLEYHGFDIDSEEFIRDYSLVSEALASCLMRSLGREHPLQKIQHKLEEMIGEDT